MHFHLPKPLHGWREFVGEVGIIVIGVLIALTFEAIVDDLKWHAKVSEAQTQLRYELGHDMAILADRAAEQRCVERRLDQLQAVIARASQSGRLPPVTSVGAADSYFWSSSVWESQMAAQTVTHFPAGQTAAFSRVYRIIDGVADANRNEGKAWLTLETMIGPGRAVDPSTVTGYLEALQTARKYNRAFGFEGPEIRRILENGALGADFPQVDPKNPPFLAGHWSICKPLTDKRTGSTN